MAVLGKPDGIYRPTEILVDGGYAQHGAIDDAAERDVTLYAPVPKPRKDDARDPHPRTKATATR